MILESRFAPSVSPRSMFAIALVAILVLPSFVLTTKSEALAGSNEEAQATPARKAEAPATADFLYAVKFEQGATRFTNDDKITIDEVRGTAETFAQGNIYCIKGRYALASRERAILLASITVTDLGQIMASRLDMAVRADHVISGKATGTAPGHATGAELKAQRVTIDRGSGAFTLFLPMSHKGLPHVSFYSLENGEGFGGNYFGTGDSVLAQWWETQEKDQPAKSSPAVTNARAPATPARKPDASATIEFPHVVRFGTSARRNSRMATRSRSTKFAAPTPRLCRAKCTPSRELTRWPRTSGECWPPTRRPRTLSMPQAPASASSR